MLVYARVPEEVHRRVKIFASRRNLRISEAYRVLVFYLLDGNGNFKRPRDERDFEGFILRLRMGWEK